MKKSKPELKTQSDSYQIDQSGKVEDTSKSTVVTLANGKIITITISAVEKRKLINTMTDIRKPNRTYAYDIFAALIYMLIQSNPILLLEIDKEYPGHEAGIKERLLQFLAKNDTSKIPEISFGLVGKKSQAHIAGLSVFQGKVKPTIVVKAQDLLKVILGNKKGWRPQSS